MICCFSDKDSFRDKVIAHHGGGRKHSWIIYNIFAVVRFLQFVTGIVVLALYIQGIDIHTNISTMPEAQLPAVIIGGVSALAALVFMFPYIAMPGTIWWMDMILCSCYGGLFATWGGKYLGQPDPGLGNPVNQDSMMHHACYVDATGMVLWALTGSYAAYKFYRERKRLKKEGPTGDCYGGDSGGFQGGGDDDYDA